MMHPSQSAIQKHYFESILPHPTFPIQKQIPKSRDFYHPEAFIWNNPHRASQNMYKFYHVYQDHYLRQKEPLIKQQQQLDRQETQSQRINRLIAFRNKTRGQFFQKQKSRLLLQAKIKPQSHLEPKTIKTDTALLGMDSNYTLTHLREDIEPKKNTRELRSRSLLKIQETYREGLRKYDIKAQEINRLIQEQNDGYHTKIRSQFATRKNVNDSSNSKFYSRVKQTSQNER